MQPAKRSNRETVAQHVAEQAISLVFARPEPVAMLDARAPAGDVANPWAEPVVDANVLAQHVAAPTVMVAGDHRDGNAGVDDVRERGERSKTAAGNHRPPLEPELE